MKHLSKANLLLLVSPALSQERVEELHQARALLPRPLEHVLVRLGEHIIIPYSSQIILSGVHALLPRYFCLDLFIIYLIESSCYI